MTGSRNPLLVGLATLLIAACGPADPSTDAGGFVNPNKKMYAGPETTSGTVMETDTKSDTVEPDIKPEEAPDPGVMPEIPYAMAEPPADAAAPWPGELVSGALVEVVLVTDGDTIKVDTGSEIVTLRLEAINAPECDKRSVAGGKSCDPGEQDFAGEAEPYGVDSWSELNDLIAGELVQIACLEENGACQKDRYQRAIGFVLRDGLDVSEQMTAAGLAWTYTQFPPDNIYTYCHAEDAAIEAGRGMWADGRDAAVAGMNSSTRHWYAYHDGTCRQYAP